jgi:hypothetical protein
MTAMTRTCSRPEGSHHAEGAVDDILFVSDDPVAMVLMSLCSMYQLLTQPTASERCNLLYP